MIVRKIEAKDFIKVLTLLDQLNHQSVEQLPNTFKVSPTKVELVKKIMHDENSDFFVVEDNFEVIAVAEIHYKQTKNIDVLIDKKYVYIQNLIVDVRYRSCGVGKKLIREIKKHAFKNGITSVKLSVIPTNKRAIKFYRDMGFEMNMYSMELE